MTQRHSPFRLPLILALGLAAPLLAGCVVTVPSAEGRGLGDISAVEITPASADASERQALALINAHRSRNGLPTVSYDARLQAAAESHSRWMAQTGAFTHTGAGASNMVTRMKAAGYCPSDANENIAYGQGSAQRLVDGWIASEGHNGNMLEDGMTHGAVAVVRNAGGTPYWTMVLGEAC